MPINILLFWIMICGNNYFDKKWHVCCIHKTRDTQHFTNGVEVIIELHLRGFVIHGLESWYEQCRHDVTYAAGNLARNDSPISRSRVPHYFWLCDEALAHTKIVYVVSIDYNTQDKADMTNIHEQNSSNLLGGRWCMSAPPPPHNIPTIQTYWTGTYSNLYIIKQFLMFSDVSFQNTDSDSFSSKRQFFTDGTRQPGKFSPQAQCRRRGAAGARKLTKGWAASDSSYFVRVY